MFKLILAYCQKQWLVLAITCLYIPLHKYKALNKSLNQIFIKGIKGYKTRIRLNKKGQEGQLIIEYVLLLTVVTVLASQLISLMIGQGATPDEQGLVVRKWSDVINAIAADLIDN